jgi:hypothetical protein
MHLLLLLHYYYCWHSDGEKLISRSVSVPVGERGDWPSIRDWKRHSAGECNMVLAHISVLWLRKYFKLMISTIWNYVRMLLNCIFYFCSHTSGFSNTHYKISKPLRGILIFAFNNTIQKVKRVFNI